jgi:hypothetical protein
MPCIVREATFDRNLIIWALRAIYLWSVFLVHLDTCVLPIFAKMMTRTMHEFWEWLTLLHIAMLLAVVVKEDGQRTCVLVAVSESVF